MTLPLIQSNTLLRFINHNNNLNSVLLFFILSCLLTACSQPKVVPVIDQSSEPQITKKTEVVTTNKKPSAEQQAPSIKTKLLNQYHAWQGVPYRYGGLSKQGIDCSGFVYVTFQQLFSIRLPRTTQRQSAVGDNISITQLKTGDLVFFKRGRSFRHVGIYLNQGNFLHASTSKGITISKLSNPFWSDRFWLARRILKKSP